MILQLAIYTKCFTHSVMYSHYADSHKGICLEFMISDYPFFNYTFPVHYTEKIPVFHAFNEDKKSILEELTKFEILTESSSWWYEDEWRIIKNDSNSGIYLFPPNVLTSIIFGFQTPSDDKLLIEKIIAERVPQIQLKEAIKKERSFDLEIRPYKS